MASKLTQKEQAERYQQALAKKAARAKKSRKKKKDSGLVEVRNWIHKPSEKYQGFIPIAVYADPKVADWAAKETANDMTLYFILKDGKVDIVSEKTTV